VAAAFSSRPERSVTLWASYAGAGHGWWSWWLITALFALEALYDSVFRLPRAWKALRDVTEERDRYKDDLAELQERFDRVDAECWEALEQLHRIKDPEYYSALDAGDGQALYDLDKKRSLI
jgi:hypothetical protein